MDRDFWIALLELIMLISTVVTIFIGIRSAVKTLKADGEDGNEDPALAKKLYKRSYLFVAIGIVCYIIMQFLAIHDTMAAEGADFLTIAMQALWDGVRRIGWLIVVPLILRNWRIRAS